MVHTDVFFSANSELISWLPRMPHATERARVVQAVQEVLIQCWNLRFLLNRPPSQHSAN